MVAFSDRRGYVAGCISFVHSTAPTMKALTFSLILFPFVLSISLLNYVTTNKQTYYADRFYELRITCPEKYPAVPPNVRFISKINMNCVDAKTGQVNGSKLNCMRNWNRNMGIEQVLQSIRMEMCSDANRRLRQPADGSTF
jgi:ubiquitin-protein ligase